MRKVDSCEDDCMFLMTSHVFNVVRLEFVFVVVVFKPINLHFSPPYCSSGSLRWEVTELIY